MSPRLLVADIGRTVEFYTKKPGFDVDFQFRDFYSAINKNGFSIHVKEGKVSFE
ncbi:MAG: hypothetical protein ACHQET_07140 [Chitinophagales bacterium]